MGKTELTCRLGEMAGHAGCTARQLLRHGARALLGNATTLVVDALDEVAARGEGDAIDRVLAKLAEGGFPRFVLTCRVADWRSATALSALQEDYPEARPLVLHLEPLTEADIELILADRLAGSDGTDRARAVVDHFKTRNLDGLLGNPQTLELIARTVSSGPLPETKSALLLSAVDVLRREHRDERIALQPDELTALEAAGSAFAALILPGADAVVRDVANHADDVLPWAEVVALPGAAALDRVLGSRLFGGRSAEHFTYWHRTVGEYLGARWLASRCATALGRRRVLQLFHSDVLVPASLRGLHAWLAHQGDRELALNVIAHDPMGVIEYGDGDALGLEEAGALLSALHVLALRDSGFREWKRYSIGSVLREELLPSIQVLITDPSVPFGLRSMLLEALGGSRLAEQLAPELRCLMLDTGEVYALRFHATKAMFALDDEDWEAHAGQLRDDGNLESARLAVEIAASLDDFPISDALLIELIRRCSNAPGRLDISFRRLAEALPDERLASFLDAFVPVLVDLRGQSNRLHSESADLGARLIFRCLDGGAAEPLRVWRWLSFFDRTHGSGHGAHRDVHDHLRSDDRLRRAIQTHVLLTEPSDEDLWVRHWRLTRRSPGLWLTQEDAVILLGVLYEGDPRDRRWRDVLRLVRVGGEEGSAIRERAKNFVANRADMIAWIDRQAQPRPAKWQIIEIKTARRRQTKNAVQWSDLRRSYGPFKDRMRAGELSCVLDPARVYLGVIRDIGDGLQPHDRLVTWLGEDLAGAAEDGFVAFLNSESSPTAREVAESYAQDRSWNAADVLVAGVATLWSRDPGQLGELSDDRLMAVQQVFWRTRIEQEAKLDGLEAAVEQTVADRHLRDETVRQYLEPQFAAQRAHIDRLWGLMRDQQSRDFASAAAEDWLDRFPNMSEEAESVLLDHLLRNGRLDTLRRHEAARPSGSLPAERRANWDAVAVVVDFAAQRERLEGVANARPEWMWTLRGRLGGERRIAVSLPLATFAWIFTTFRDAFPLADHPTGVFSGDRNAWDASDFLTSAVVRIADDTSHEATQLMQAFRLAPTDRYTNLLSRLAAEQMRKQVQQRYNPVRLAGLRTIIDRRPPSTVADLQATMLALLEAAQARIRSSPDDAWRGFYDDAGQPRDEERCRDHLLTIIGLHPEGIDLMPEGHLANDRRADIIAQRPGLRLPIEIKGQWHSEVWRAADSQLNRLYAADYAADRRGIYLVLWFGHAIDASRYPRARAIGQRRPQSPHAMCDGLIETSEAARSGAIAVVVLDMSHPTAGATATS